MLIYLKAITLFLLLGIIIPKFVCADEFEDAVKSINHRDYETGYKMIVPLAEKGKAAAQLVLGMMYFKGTGVEKNIIESDKWLYISEALGQEAGKKNRIFVERQMNSDQITKAHQLAKDWLKKR
jgi:TPR repeat protein